MLCRSLLPVTWSTLSLLTLQAGQPPDSGPFSFSPPFQGGVGGGKSPVIFNPTQPPLGKGSEQPTHYQPPKEGEPVQWPGVKHGGGVLLPNGWSLKPIGRQTALGDFPVNIALHPSGKFVAILHAGYGDHEIIIIDAKSAKKLSRVLIDQAFMASPSRPMASGCSPPVASLR